ncbi:MAG TPA: anti-sigma factor [bacterium]|nr:anti-sigma factor [bacterium]
MSTCVNEHTLFLFQEGALSAAEMARCRDHLETCPTCRHALQELQDVQTLLVSRERPTPPAALLERFHSALRERFRIQSPFERLVGFVTERWNNLHNAFPVPVRLAKAAALLIAGVLIGAAFFSPSPDADFSRLRNTGIVMVTPGDVDIKSLGEFVTKSEILLLALINSQDQLSLTPPGESVEREIAVNLLQQSPYVEQTVDRLNDQSVEQYLRNLEVILVALVNPPAKNHPGDLAEIKEMIKEKRLLSASRRISDSLQYSLQQRGTLAGHQL